MCRSVMFRSWIGNNRVYLQIINKKLQLKKNKERTWSAIVTYEFAEEGDEKQQRILIDVQP